MLKQIWWQRFGFPVEFKRADCQIVSNTDAVTISTVRPAFAISRDMLSYEPCVIEPFGFGKAPLKLLLLPYTQNRSLRVTEGLIFLTRYAGKVIQQSYGPLHSIAYIPHCVDAAFKQARQLNSWPEVGKSHIRCRYV